MASSLLASRRNKLIVLGNWLLWTTLHAYVLYEWGLSWDISSIDAAINNSVLLVGCILAHRQPAILPATKRVAALPVAYLQRPAAR